MSIYVSLATMQREPVVPDIVLHVKYSRVCTINHVELPSENEMFAIQVLEA